MSFNKCRKQCYKCNFIFKKEYGKFKRRFIQVAETLGFEGDIKTHVDLIFAEINKSKTETQPFLPSDMVPLGAAKELRYEIEDPKQPVQFCTEEYLIKHYLTKRQLQFI